jgi:hypothetical protein
VNDLPDKAKRLYDQTFPNVVRGAFGRPYDMKETMRGERHLMRAEKQGKPRRIGEAENRLGRMYGSMRV